MKTTFNGRTRAETKRKALAFWAHNRESLGLSMREFFERCSSSVDGTTIVFSPPKREPSPLRFLARLRGHAS